MLSDLRATHGSPVSEADIVYSSRAPVLAVGLAAVMSLCTMHIVIRGHPQHTIHL